MIYTNNCVVLGDANEKNIPLHHVIRDFVTKTKITIWAESIVESARSFFFFSKVLPDSDILKLNVALDKINPGL